MMQGKFDDANKILLQAIALKPNMDNLHNILGNFLSSIKNYKKAEEAYQQALKINPRNGHTHGNLCFVLWKQPGREQEAKQYCEKGIELPNTYGFPTSSQAFSHIKYAEILSDQGKYTDSIRQYEEAKQQDPYYDPPERCYASEKNKLEQLQIRKALVETDQQWHPKNDPDLKIKRSIVKITAEFPTPSYPATGVVIYRSKNRALILTARHVVYDKNNMTSANVYVEFFSKPPTTQPLMRRYAKVIKSVDEDIDLALLEIVHSLPDDIQAINMSKDTRIRNNSIRIIGHNGTQGEKESWSSISLNKITRKSEKEIVISQSQLPSGFSGAPILNSHNELLGIHFKGRTDLQQDFAYPISIITKQFSRWSNMLKP
jgi:tetratricopeptide (TPR) repeat protein